MTLEELHKLAEECGGLLIPDDEDGPEVVFDIDAFEKFTDAADVAVRFGFLLPEDRAEAVARAQAAAIP